MKLNFLFVAIITFVLFTILSFTFENSTNQLRLHSLTSFKELNHTRFNSQLTDCQYGRCARIKDDGKQCKNCAQQDSYYCWSHRN